MMTKSPAMALPSAAMARLNPELGQLLRAGSHGHEGKVEALIGEEELGRVKWKAPWLQQLVVEAVFEVELDLAAGRGVGIGENVMVGY
jgi:hypothetical protein